MPKSRRSRAAYLDTALQLWFSSPMDLTKHFRELALTVAVRVAVALAVIFIVIPAAHRAYDGLFAVQNTLDAVNAK